jgi:hypothetical protein
MIEKTIEKSIEKIIDEKRELIASSRIVIVVILINQQSHPQERNH